MLCNLEHKCGLFFLSSHPGNLSSPWRAEAVSGFEVHSASPGRADAAGGSYVGVDTVVFLLEDSWCLEDDADCLRL